MKRLLLFALCLLGASTVWCEQFIKIGGYQAHYMILDTLSLEPEVAAAYGITRARDQSILTVSVLDADGKPVDARVTGSATNLLGVAQTLFFEAITEGESHYAIAPLKHSEEQMRFSLLVQPPGGQAHQVKFEQKLYLGIEH